MGELEAKSYALRRDILDLVYRSGTGHIGGDFSVCDILNVLYNRIMNVSPETFDLPDHDRLILSKGHSVEALYCVLADRGFFPAEDLLCFSTFGSPYIGHPNRKVRGVEMNTGSLGHGLSLAVGMALSARMDGTAARVYTIMGDGELAEGSVWEAAMAGGHYQLANLTAVVDRNRLQISGPTEAVMAHEDLAARWAAFGWNVLRTDGNQVAALTAALEKARLYEAGPSVVIADTVKGFGVSFMEDNVSWHHRVPTGEEYRLAVRELDQKEAQCR